MTQVIGTPFAPSTSSTSYSFAVPAGVTSSMVGVFAFGSANSTAVTPVTMASSGATFTVLDNRAATNMYVTVVKATGLSAGNTVTLGLGSNQIIYLHHFYQDAYDIATTGNASGIRSGSTTTATSGSVTPTAGQNVLLVGLERTLATGTTLTSAVSSGAEPVSQVAYSEDAANPAVSVYFGTFTASAAAARTATITWRDASTNAYAGLFLTTPIVVPPPVGKPLHYVTSDHTIGSAQAFYTLSPGTLSVPSEVRVVPTGYPSVSAMLATPHFAVAHRGGDLDWPEMSLYGYTQSVFWGIGALELSCNRTSDGVWVGIHDATLDRTSGTTGFNIASHTWADVQAYNITASLTNNTSQPVRPYMRWEELIDAYYDTHVIFIDPKYGASYITELLGLMDALPGAPTDRLVAKYYGVSSGWPTQASAHGYKTWGYFYEADYANVPAYQGRWDILGMDYTATSTSWTQIMSYGKPVIGHIVPSAAGAITAFGYGANGIMVSGVKEAVTRTPNAS